MRRRILSSIALIVMLAVLSVGCSKKNTSVTDANTTVTPGGEAGSETTPTPSFSEEIYETNIGTASAFSPQMDGLHREIWKLCDGTDLKNSVFGEGTTAAWYKVLWDTESVYVLVHVTDDTPDTTAESAFDRDSVFFFLNEDCSKPTEYSFGDAFYAVDRDGQGFLGTGASEAGFRSITYPDDSGKGYYVEVRIPLLTVTGRYDLELGFDIRVNNAAEGELQHVITWSDLTTSTDVTLRGVGTLCLD